MERLKETWKNYQKLKHQRLEVSNKANSNLNSFWIIKIILDEKKSVDNKNYQKFVEKSAEILKRKKSVDTVGSSGSVTPIATMLWTNYDNINICTFSLYTVI